MKQKFLVAATAALVLLSACDKIGTKSKGTYANSTFILNEGPFNTGTGTLTAFSNDTIVQSAFAKENGFPLGNIAQHMASTDSLLFLSINNSSKVHCVSRITLRHKWTAEIESPRCLAAYEGNLFVTGWSGSYVYVLSQDNGAVLDSINVSFGSDAIAIAEDKLFVAVSDWTGPYKLAVIDLPSYNVNLYDISDVPNSFAVVGQNVYLLCSGYTDWSGNGADSEAKLWRYSLLSNTLEVAAIAPNVNAHASSLTTDGVNLYWLNEAYGGAVVKWFNGDSWPNTTLTLSGAYQVQYLDGFLYYFDAKDYVSNGVVYKFTTDGTYLDSIDAGVIPRQILN